MSAPPSPPRTPRSGGAPGRTPQHPPRRSLRQVLCPAPFGRRMVQLNAGLVLYGVSTALLLRAGLGVDPWTVLHQGLAQVTGLTVGVVSILAGLLVLALWWPLRQRPGIGTVLDAVVVGLVTDAALTMCPRPGTLGAQAALLAGAVVLNAAATACYLGAGLGPGPRDGLMTGLAARGRSLRVMRTLIELTALGSGWLLGGPVGIGTVVYALSIGPLAQLFIPWLELRPAGVERDPS